VIKRRLASYFFLKDPRALPDQTSFVLTLRCRRLVFAVRDGNGANKNEIAISIFGVTAKDFTHERLRKPACSSILTPSNLLLDFAGNLVEPAFGTLRFIAIKLALSL
jgi:hypothetical protein